MHTGWRLGLFDEDRITWMRDEAREPTINRHPQLWMRSLLLVVRPEKDILKADSHGLLSAWKKSAGKHAIS
jgi:hypothetical protein